MYPGVRLLFSLLFILSVSAFMNVDAQKKISSLDLKSWPAGKSPQETGKRIAEHFVASPHFNYFRPTPPVSIVYPETCTWYGALTFAKLTKDADLYLLT